MFGNTLRAVIGCVGATVFLHLRARWRCCRSLTDHLSFTVYVNICVCVCVRMGVWRDTHLSPAFFLSLHQSTVPQPTFSMPVTVPVSNQNAAAALQFSNNPGGALVTTTSFVTSTLTDPRLLSPQQPSLQRNTVSPGLPQRPASAGKRNAARLLLV